ncbi:unnamed protein product [Microthlaspi erraticum]|uniref:Uncharacterized protein n=1 Tax=Microthlaspi erraticum TaxID=1685480 RepID=A0A6D2HYE6_9BRAS|nr:unnamed protein product [Microthlaspi erraticum]
MIHASFQVKSINLSPSDNSRYQAETKLRKFGRERRRSRRPKVTILIWKDRYLSHASRRSEIRHLDQPLGRNLFSTKTCPVSDQTEPLEDLEYFSSALILGSGQTHFPMQTNSHPFSSISDHHHHQNQHHP